MEPEPARAPGARWEELFDELAELDLPDRERRLAEIAGADPALAAHLARLLAADGETTGLLARPAAEILDAAEEDSPLPAGSRVGSWRLLQLLGRGGMGEVYVAERDEGTFTQRAALKLIKRGMDSRAIVRRFVRERQILSRLEHSGIARLLDGGSAEDGRPFFVLERVAGVPIDEHCRARGLGLEERLRLVQSVCAAVDSAHHSLVVHRDLKPANVLVTANGAVKLLDFGIAKLLSGDEEETAQLTQLGACALTPAYAAPEQILGEPVTTATDVYALGVLLFELITGTLPHAREHRSLRELVSGVERETAERPSGVLRRTDARLSRRVSGDLDLIVLTAMHRDPARRYASAAALADDLGRFLAGRPVRARPDSRGYRLRKFAGRHRLAISASALGLAALLAGLGLALWQARAARLAAQRADAEARRTERVKSFVLSVFRQSDPNQSDATAVTARELVEQGVQRIDTELAGDHALQADVLSEVVNVENDLGLMDQALAHARRALLLRETVLPRGDARIAQSRVLLGAVQRRHGDVDQARQTLEKALSETLKAHGAGSLQVATASRALARTLYRSSDRPRAIELLRQALATLRRRLGDGHLETAETLAELGIALEVGQQYGEAEKVDREALARLEHALGPHHPKVALAQGYLAGLLDRLSRSAEARKLLEAAIATQRAVLGPRHMDLAGSLLSYGVLLIGQQELKGADAAMSEALGIFGPDRFESGHCLRYLGVSAMKQERYRDAAGLFTRAAGTYARVLGENDAERWRTIAALGWAHLKLGEISLARRELSEAVSRLERLGGPESYELRLPLRELGETLTRAGATTEAIATLTRVRRLDEKVLGTTQHGQVGSSDLLLAQALLARGDPGDRQAARRTLDEAIAIFTHIGSKDPLFGKVLLESGKLALSAGDRPRARRELAAAQQQILLLQVPSRHELIREIHRLLAQVGG